jgi:hypothetical protein
LSLSVCFFLATLSHLSAVWVCVSAGYRLPCPPACPDYVHMVMLSCWETDPNDRPGFDLLANNIRNFYHTQVNVEGMDATMKASFAHAH